MFTKKKRFLTLALVFLVLAVIYWGLGNTELALPVVLTYGVLCFLLSILYVLVNGGLRPLMDEDKKREEKSREKYLKDKGKMHPVKRKDKYKRFTVKTERETSTKLKEKAVPRPNPFKLGEEERVLYSQILLVTVIPFYLIFLLDWLYATLFY